MVAQRDAFVTLTENSFASTRKAARSRNPASRNSAVRMESGSPEPLGSPGTGARGFELAVPRLGARLQGFDQPPRRRGDLFHRAVERRFIHLRRLVIAGKLAHELQRCRADLLFGRWRFEIE